MILREAAIEAGLHDEPVDDAPSPAKMPARGLDDGQLADLAALGVEVVRKKKQ